MSAMLLLLATATVVTLAFNGEKLARDVQEGFETNREETVEGIFGKLPADHQAVIGFSVPGSGRFAAIHKDRLVTMAAEDPFGEERFQTLATGSPQEAEAVANHYLIGFNYSRKQQLHFMNRRIIATAAGPQTAIAFVGSARRKSDGFLPMLVSPLRYEDDRCIILIQFPKRLYTGKAMTDFSDEFDALGVSLAEVINTTRLSQGLRPAGLSQAAGEETTGE